MYIYIYTPSYLIVVQAIRNMRDADTHQQEANASFADLRSPCRDDGTPRTFGNTNCIAINIYMYVYIHIYMAIL